MAGIRSANTSPELIIRRGLHRLGYRFRLHAKDLRGRPDIVFRKRRALIFVNGCFWHGHACHLFKWPTSRQDYWLPKLRGNIQRDRVTRARLAELGWRICDVWECQLKGKARRSADEVLSDCVAFLEGDARYASIGTARTVDDSGVEMEEIVQRIPLS